MSIISYSFGIWENISMSHFLIVSFLEGAKVDTRVLMDDNLLSMGDSLEVNRDSNWFLMHSPSIPVSDPDIIMD